MANNSSRITGRAPAEGRASSVGVDRFDKAFKDAPRLPIDKDSKFVVFSDCHRGNGDQNDNFADNQNIYFTAIQRYFEDGYTYIELGDGDELWENRDFQYITDQNSHVFWLLNKFWRAGRLRMVYGNHDMVKRRKKWRAANLETYHCERYNHCLPLFNGIDVSEGLILHHRETGRSLYLMHGHQGDLLNDKLWRLSRFLVRYVWRPLELVGIKDPTSTAENRSKQNKQEERLTDWAREKDVLLIAGHTHRPVFPRPGQPLYFNDGSCVHPRCVTALEITGGDISLVKWSVETRDDGALYVARSVLEGPVPLTRFFRAHPGCIPS